MTHKRYLVTGSRSYRWHKPGTAFEANLDPDAEQRAIERGSIRVLDVITPGLENGSYTLPDTEGRGAAGVSREKVREGR